jgi:hypothetical protein
MSNGARHGLGIVAGLVLTAALIGLTVFGTYELQHGYLAMGHKQDKYIAAGLLAGAGVILALLMASRLSPVAALIGGLVLAGVGVMYFVSTKTAGDIVQRFPFKDQRPSLTFLDESGILLFVGVGLLFSLVFPSRWRSYRAEGSAGSEPKYEYGVPETASYEPTAGEGYGRHSRDPLPYAEQHPNYEAPLYEQPTAGDPFNNRAPFSPSEDTRRAPGGPTQEIPRPGRSPE